MRYVIMRCASNMTAGKRFTAVISSPANDVIMS